MKKTASVPPEVDSVLENLAQKSHCTKAQVLKKAISLYKIAQEASKNNRKIAIVKENDELETEITGI